MLTIFSNSALDDVVEGLEFDQTLMQEGLKFFSGDKDINLFFYLPLILLLAKQSRVCKKSGYKIYFILTFDTSGFEMIFALLKGVVTV